jgi:hypothetical protein
MSVALKDTAAGRSIDSADRERRKRLWLDPVKADLRTPDALATAKEHHVSLRLAHQIAGLVVNLNSFLDAGYIYPSQAGLADYIKGANDQRMSDRQVRRGIAFMEARGHLRVVRLRGTRNRMYPLYRAAGTVAAPTEVDARAPDTMSSDQGHGVRGVRTWCPPKPSNKPIYKTEEPPLPPRSEPTNVVRLATSASTAESPASGQPMKEERTDQTDDNPRPLEGELLGPAITFDQFWEASSQRGEPGFALAMWNKLSRADHRAISDCLRDGVINDDGMLAGTWLKHRRWEVPPLTLRKRRGEFRFEFKPRRRVVWSPTQPEFKAEYARRLNNGEDVDMMEGAMRRGGLCTLDL